MRRFIVNVLAFSSFLLALGVGMECMLRRVPNVYAFKRGMIERHGDGIRTLILGSSVAANGITPSVFPDSTYNLAISGQWLPCTLEMFRHYRAYMPNVRDVVLGATYPELWKEDDVWSEVEHDIYMDVTVSPHLIPRSELFSLRAYALRKWSKYYILHGKTMTCDSLGVDHGSRSPDLKEKAPARVAEHNGWISSDTGGVLYRKNVARLRDLARLCGEQGATLWIVVLPVHEIYRQGLDARHLSKLRATLSGLASGCGNVRYLDYLTDPRFTDEDFYDGSHLSAEVGGLKFSRILREDMGM